MTKSKALVLANAPDPVVVAQWHQYVIDAGAISAASAIICGKELLAVQKSLKGTSVTYDQWLEKHQATLGFSRSTSFNYINAYKDTKSKLLKTADKATLALLESDARRLSAADRKKLFNAVRKCIGGQSLIDIYLEAGIVRNVHKQPLRLKNGDGAGDEGDDSNPVDPVKEAVDEQLELFGQRSNLLHRKTKVGREDILVVSRWPKAKITTAISIIKRDLTMLVKLQQGMK